MMPAITTEHVSDCPLSRATPFAIGNVSMTQFSVARFSGGCKINGESYTYILPHDQLVRDDVLKWLKGNGRLTP